MPDTPSTMSSSSLSAPNPAYHWSAERSAAGQRNPWLIAWIISIATFMEVLDTSIANVSLRHIAGSLGAGLDESTWVISSYLVANAAILPVSGWLAGVIGRKRFYMSCVVLFTLSSFCCGFAPSLSALIFFRVLQGLGGGGLVPCEQSMLADTFPPEKRGQAFALYGIAVVVAPTLGPTLGGWITDAYSWRWIFYLNVPVGLISLFLTWRYVVEPPILAAETQERRRHSASADYAGFFLVAFALGCLEVTLSNGERYDWLESGFIRSFAFLAAASMLAALIWEWKHEAPVFDVHLMAARNFGITLLMMFCTGFALFSSTTQLPMLLQGSHGYTSLLAGLALTPGGLVTFTLMPLVGFLTRKVQLRYLIAIGLVLQAAALWHMSNFPADLSFAHAVWARMFQAAGLAFLFIPITTLSYHGLAPVKNNAASSMLSVARNVGGSVGIAFANTLIAQRIQFHHLRLAEHINFARYGAVMSISRLQEIFQAGGAGELSAENQALQVVQNMINRQSAIMAFNDFVYVAAWIMAGIVLLVPFLAKSKAQRDGAGGH